MNRSSIKEPVTLYHWKAINASGETKKGQLLASTPELALMRLAQQHLVVIKIQPRFLSCIDDYLHPVTHKDLHYFIDQMATMLSSGLPITQTLDLTLHQTHQVGMYRLITQLKSHIENGETLSHALADSHPYFNGLISELLKAGELTGQVSETLSHLSDYLKKQQALIAKVKRAAIYPSVVSGVSLVVTYLMLTQIIPQFELMFHNLGADLPWFTQVILDLSHSLQSWGVGVLLLMLTLTTALRSLYRSQPKLRFYTHYLRNHLPIVGGIIHKATIARFCQTFATTNRCGIPILQAMDAALHTSHDLVFQRALQSLSHHISTGLPLYLALQQTEQFSELMIQLIMVGEESGRLDQALDNVSRLCQQDVENSVENLEKLLEPLVIATLGIIVGSLVIAMYLPIFNLMNVLG